MHVLENETAAANPPKPATQIFTIEVWRHGWLICAPAGKGGVPVAAIEMVSSLPGARKSVLANGLAHHYNTKRRDVVFCICLPENLSAWEQEVQEEIASLPAETRWWQGLDVGSASACIFSILASDVVLRLAAAEIGRDSTPLDSEDFGSCKRLVNQFGWEARLEEIAAKFPNTHWPQIVSSWGQLSRSSDAAVCKFLREL